MTDRICPLNDRVCRCDPKATDKKLHPCVLAKRVGKLFRLLGSNHEGEAIAATTGLRRLVPAEGLDFNDLAVLIENANGKIEELKYSDAEVMVIFKRGVEKGRAESRGQTLSADYFDSDGYPRWDAMVKFCREQPTFASLKPNEREFIDEMPAKLRWRAPTRPMGGFLLSIFWKLGGSFQ